MYCAHDAADLVKLLPAIRRWHPGQPLSEDELEGLVWPAQTEAVEDGLARLLSERPGRAP